MKYDLQNLNLVDYSVASQTIQSGWIAQFRTRRYFARLVQYGTGGPHSHSAMLRRNHDGSIDCLEMIEGVGGRAVPLKSQVIECDGLIDVFSIDQRRWPEWNGVGAVDYMRELTGRKYNWGNLWRIALRRVPLVWRWFPFDVDDARESKSAVHCSHAVGVAARIGGGLDPVPRKPDYLLTPNDLTWSLLFEYEFTLTGGVDA